MTTDVHPKNEGLTPLHFESRRARSTGAKGSAAELPIIDYSSTLAGGMAGNGLDDLVGGLDEREAHCVRSFDRWLDEFLPEAERYWMPSADDPPDCWLQLDSTAHAVEITSTKTYAGLKEAQPRVPLESYTFSCRALTEAIERHASSRHQLRGFYGMSFSPAGAVGRAAFRNLKRHVRREALAYISKHAEAATAVPRNISFGGRRVCTIGKFANAPDHIVFTATDAQSEGETISDLRFYLEDALKEKAGKLRDKGAKPPWILLLLNTDTFAEKRPQLYTRCTSGLPLLDTFHSVFVVWGDGAGFMLHSADHSWAGLASTQAD